MPVTAAIKFTQGMTTDLAGRALIGTLGGGAVVASNGDNSGVEVWTWEIVDVPPTSAVPVGVVSIGDAATMSFTPDVRGSYLVQLTVQDASGNVAVDLRAFSILETTGRLIPPFGAPASALNYAGQPRGWAKYMEQYLHAVDAGGGGVVVKDEGGSLGTFSALDFLGAGVTASNLGGGVAGVTVPGGGGAPVPSTVTDWYVDPVSGNDANNGLTGGTAFKTFAKLASTLLGFSLLVPTGNALTIHVLSDGPSTDPLILKGTLGRNCRIQVVGQATVATSGTFDGKVDIDRPNNIPQGLVDTGNASFLFSQTFDAVSYFSKRLKITSGGGTGAWTWLCGSTNPGDVLQSIFAPVFKVGYPEYTSYFGRVSPGVGTTYSIEALTHIYYGTIDVDCVDPPLTDFMRVAFTDLVISAKTYLNPRVRGYLGFFGCCVIALQGWWPAYETLCYIENCQLNTFFAYAGHYYIVGGCAVQSLQMGVDGTMSNPIPATSSFLLYDFIVGGGDIRLVRGEHWMANVAAFNSSTNDGGGINVGSSSIHTDGGRVFAKQLAAGHWYGQGHVGAVGLAVWASSTASIASNVPTIVGASGDWLVGGNSNEVTWDGGAWIYAPSGAKTWANFATAYFLGGWSKNAHEPGLDAHLYYY